MNSTTNKNTILHRSSRRINRSALSIPVGRADFEKSVTAHAYNLLFLSSSFPFRYFPILQTAQSNATLVPSTSLALGTSQLTPLVKPRKLINIGAFNVRTLAKIGQQASLAITLDTLRVDICCVSETRIQDFSTVVHLSCPNSTEKFFLHLSGDDTAAAVGSAGVGIALSNRTEMVLLD